MAKIEDYMKNTASYQEQAQAAKILAGGAVDAKEAVGYRHAIEAAAESLDDETALQYPKLYPAWEDLAGQNIEMGRRVRHEDILYKCLQTHTAQPDWAPDAAQSLFAKVLIPDETVIPEWEQPGSTNPYMMGDKVTHNGKTWESEIDNNVWEPGIYGWREVGVVL